MKKLMYILLFLLIAANVAAQESYVIDLVCVGADRYYRIDGEKGSTYEWYVKDTLGNEISNPPYTNFQVEKSPGDTIWGSEINIVWSDVGVFFLSTLHYSSHGCDTLEQGWIEVYELPDADAGKDMILCSNEAAMLSTDLAWNFSSLTWTSTGDGIFNDDTQLHPTYLPGKADSISGSVTLILTAYGRVNSAVCEPAIDSMVIRYSSPSVTLSFADLLCYNDSAGWIKADVSGGIEPYNYNWTGPGTFTSNNDLISGLAAGKYFLTVTDSIGCLITDSVEIIEPVQLLATITADTTEICDYGIISLNALSSGGTGSYTHLWTGNGSAFLSAADIVNPFFENALAGIYTLIYTVTDENGCVAADTIDLTVLPKDTISVDTVICGNEVPFAWYGNDYFFTGIYTDTLPATVGCDTILILNLTVLPIDTIKVDTIICISETPFAWYGKDYYTTGIYTDTLSPLIGCDTILVLDLTVLPIDTITFDTTICGLDAPFAWYGKDYLVTGIYTDTLPAMIGCDTILILDLTVLPVDTLKLDTVICGNEVPFAFNGKNYFTTNIYSDTIVSATGCDSILILNLTVLPIDTITFDTTICGIDAPLAWLGNDYFISGTYIDTIISTTDCDTIAILNLIVLPIDTLVTDVVVCGNEVPFAWNGADYFISGEYIDTLSSATGCDSILVLNLTVLPIDTIKVDTLICISETPFVWYGKDYFTTGIYTDTLSPLIGCDTILILELTVLPIDTISIDTVICGNEIPFAWYGKDYFFTGIYTDTLPALLGCDTILILDLTVIPIDTVTFDTVICGVDAPLSWLGKDYFITGTYTDTLISITGCDSIAILNLTVLPVDTLVTDTVICGNEVPFAWNGKDYFNSGMYADTLISALGCDTIAILNLTILPIDTLTIDTVICVSDTPFAWNGNNYFTSGIYSDTITSFIGCDTILILDLTVLPIDTISIDTVICVSDTPFTWHGKDYFFTGIYNDTMPATLGCDTMLILDLTVLPIDTITLKTSICASELPFAWYGKDYLAAGIYTDTLPSAAGCDTILILDLIILPVHTTVMDTILCAGSPSFEWNSQMVETKHDSIYQVALINTSGCDSILILNVTITPAITIVADTVLCAGATSFIWNGQLVEAKHDSTYQASLATAKSCDSILILNVTITPPVIVVTDTLLCAGSPSFIWNSQLIDTNNDNTYFETLTNTEGCDSTVMLNVKILPATTSLTDTTVLASELPFVWNGDLYNNAGTYSINRINVNGCDSLLTLILHVIYSVDVTDTIVCVQDLPVIWNGNEYYTAGVHPDTLVSVSGTDSIVQLNIILIPEVQPVFDQLGPYCQFSVPDTLPLTSQNGITGSWSQMEINTSINGSQLLTFTPDPGQCAAEYNIEINIDTALVVSVTIVASRLEVMEGETVTFTATPVNGGTNPVYAWFVNGSVVTGESGETFTYQPQDSDVVYAILTSSETVCIVNNPATSNKIIIKVIGTLPVSVTISANQTDICVGGSVTFTATPVNGGASPVYAWFVNGVEIPGETSVTYTYTPQNGDVVYAVLTSSLTDVTGNPATSNEIPISVTNELAVSVSIISDKTEICDGETVTFTANPVNGGLNPVYAWFVNGIEIPGETSVSFAYKPQNSDLVHATLTSDLGCATNNPAISNKIPIKVNDNATVSVYITANPIDICEGEPVTFIATSANGGTNPVFTWYVKGIPVPGETSDNFTFTPMDNVWVYAVLTSNLTCTTDDKAFSNSINIYVSKSVPVSVSIEVDKPEVCEDEMVTFTATPVNGGSVPIYAWFVNGNGIPGVTGAVFKYQPQNGDEVYARLTSNIACTTGNPANSNKVTVIVNDKHPVGISILADKTEICDSETVTFTATPLNGGSNPVYTWFVNGQEIPGQTGVTFSYQPADGDQVHVKLISSESCVTDTIALSNIIDIKFTDGLLVEVSITVTPASICTGDTATFTATPVNGGDNPVYAWFVNDKEITGETGETFVYQPADGDEIYVQLTSNANCIKDPVAISDKITISVNNGLPVSVTIVADKNNICIGEPVTFTATPVNGGVNPVYEWFVNDTIVPGATTAVLTYSPQDGDEVYTVLTSDLGCVSNNPATSNKIRINVIDQLPVSVSIVADKTEICIAEKVTFRATPTNGGDNPVYEWFVNDVKIAGEDDIIFKYKTEDGDVVYATLLSDLSCVSGNPATSNKITITVIDEQPVTVSIVADKTEICEGETVTFTATPVNGGINPVYTWFVNNIKINGATTETYAYKPEDGDVVHTVMLSDLTCVTGNPAISNKITITANDKLEVKIEIDADLDLVCEGEPVTFTTVSANGGTNPVYSWFVNNVKIDGADLDVFTYIPDNKDKVFATLESDLVCIAQKTDSSNVMVITVGDTIPPVAISHNVIVYLDADGKAAITTEQINNGSYDNCKLDTLYLSRYDFDCDDIGNNLVTLTAIDSVGLSGTTEATVTVLDTISPVVICRGPFEIQLDENASYNLTVAEVLESVEDNCKKIDTMYVYPHKLDCDHIGLTTITLMAIDINGNSSYCQTEVMIYGNRPPTVVDDSAFTKENVPVVIDIVENDFDEKTTIDISSLSISIKPLYGTVSVNPFNGDVTYTPNRNFSGVDVLKYRIYDDGIPCEPEYGEAYVYIVVEPVNDKPLAVDDYYNAGCFSVTRNVMDNDTDPDGSDNLFINTTPLVPPDHGQLIIDPDGTISYFPNEGYIGIDSFQYVIWDNGIPEPLSDTAWVYIDVDCSEETQDPLDCELFIPEGFSPNEDGIHDFFRIMCIHNYPNAKLMIFNRNGDLLWQKENYGNYDVWGDQYNAWWWGTSVLNRYDVGRQTINGDPKLKVGNYIYVLQLGNGVIKNGTVMISY